MIFSSNLLCLNVGCMPSIRSECCQHFELTWHCLQTKYIFRLCSREHGNMGGTLGIYVDTQLRCLRYLGRILQCRHLCCACPRISQRTLQTGFLTVMRGLRAKDNGMCCRETRLTQLCFCACVRTFMLTLRLHERWWMCIGDFVCVCVYVSACLRNWDIGETHIRTWFYYLYPSLKCPQSYVRY